MNDYWTDNGLEKPPQRLVCAALYRVGPDRIICGPRHFDAVMRQQIHASEGMAFWRNAEQGFVNQFGEFLNREDAYKLAQSNGQFNRRDDGRIDTLFSEDLY